MKKVIILTTKETDVEHMTTILDAIKQKDRPVIAINERMVKQIVSVEFDDAEIVPEVKCKVDGKVIKSTLDSQKSIVDRNS